MSLIVVDTNVIIRMNGAHKKFFECFEITKDVIFISKEILNEYEGAAKASILTLLTFLDNLMYKQKMKIINKGRIDAKYKQNTRKKNPSMPSDPSDRKFVEVAVACESKYLISCDSHLKDCDPIRWNNSECRVIEPINYVSEYCPELI